MQTNDMRDLAGRIVGIHATYHGECGKSTYSVFYSGKRYQSDDTAKLADLVYDQIKHDLTDT